jgi:hypothetical protein
VGRALAAGATVAAVLVAACIAACAGARGAPLQAPIDLVIAPLPATDAGTANGSQMPGTCSVQLVAAKIQKSSPTCYLDERISRAPGALYYPCNGDGPAEAQFGDHRYVGRLTGGDVELTLSTELDWEDGCQWGTTAVISGTLVSKAEPATKQLFWRYHDRILAGSNCSGVCTARTVIDVTSDRAGAREVPPAPEEPDDDDAP